MHRVLYLSRGGEIGGSQRQLFHVLSNLDRSRYEPIVVCRNDGASAEQLREADIQTEIMPLRPWRSFPKGLWRYADARRLARFALEQEVSLIHSSDLWLSQYLTSAARRISVPSVLHVRAPISPACVIKHGCHAVDALIAISRRVRNDLLSGGVLTKNRGHQRLSRYRPLPSAGHRAEHPARPIPANQGPANRPHRPHRTVQASARLSQSRRASCEAPGQPPSSRWQGPLPRISSKGGRFHTGPQPRRPCNPHRPTGRHARYSVRWISWSASPGIRDVRGHVLRYARFIRRLYHKSRFRPRAGRQDRPFGHLRSTEDLVMAIQRLMDNAELRQRLGRQARKWAEITSPTSAWPSRPRCSTTGSSESTSRITVRSPRLRLRSRPRNSSPPQQLIERAVLPAISRCRGKAYPALCICRTPDNCGIPAAVTTRLAVSGHS